MTEIKPIIAFDLDGTLAESKQSITPDMAELLYKLAGIAKVAIISGGSYSQFNLQLLPGLVQIANAHIESADDVTENISHLQNIILMPTSGSMRYEYDPTLKDWKKARVYPFAEDLRQKVITKLNLIIENRKEEFGIPEESYGDRVEDRETQVTFSGLGQRAPNDKKALWDPQSEKRQKLKAEMEMEIPEIEGRIGGMTSLDILPKGFTKATGLKALLEDSGLQISDMLFIGDAVFEGGNDYSPVEAGIETIGIAGPDETAKLIGALLQG